ncbi:hypothetical protein F4777DRAFT_101927 [Nemania sp. FL0916]|nr:hypothetical protein F4777DRAFT_101927 [Nemania sp. FL0916]
MDTASTEGLSPSPTPQPNKRVYKPRPHKAEIPFGPVEDLLDQKWAKEENLSANKAFISGPLVVEGRLHATHKLCLRGNFLVMNKLECEGNFTLNGVVECLKNPVTVKNMVVIGDGIIRGDVVVRGGLYVKGSCIIVGKLTVAGNLRVCGYLKCASIHHTGELKTTGVGTRIAVTGVGGIEEEIRILSSLLYE